MPISDYFDSVYLGQERFWWSGQNRYALDPDAHPRSLLTQQTLRLLSGSGSGPGRALDIGAGEGSDSIRLALLGYEVNAVEVSPVGAKKIECFAEQAGVEVHVIAVDIKDFIPNGPYDVIICNGVLHYVPDKSSVTALMQQATREGGINVISLWSTFTPVPVCHEIVPVYADNEDGVVVSSYARWPKEFIYFERDKPEAAHSDLPGHRHSHIKLIVRKPSSSPA